MLGPRGGGRLLHSAGAQLQLSKPRELAQGPEKTVILLMDRILHDPKDPKLWELWYISYNPITRDIP